MNTVKVLRNDLNNNLGYNLAIKEFSGEFRIAKDGNIYIDKDRREEFIEMVKNLKDVGKITYGGESIFVYFKNGKQALFITMI